MEAKINVRENLLFLMHYMKSFKINFINFYFGMLTQAVIDILAPMILGFIINEIVYYKNTDTFAALCGLYAFMILFQCLNFFLIYGNHHYLNSMYVFKIRCDLFDRILYGQSSRLSSLSAGEATTVIDEYTDDCLHFLVRNFVHFSNNIVVVLWCAYFLLKIDIRFGLLLGFILVIQILVTLRVNKRLAKLAGERVKLYGKHLGFLTSILNALKDIQILTADFFVKNIYKEKYWDYKKKEYHMLENYRLEKQTEGLQTVFLLFIYILSMFLIFRNQMLFGTFLTVMTYYEVLKSKSLYTISLMSSFNDNLSRIDQLRQMFSWETEKEVHKGTEKGNELKGTVRFSDCSFSYDTRQVLQNVSFEVKEGEHAAIVGASGIGKSTILALINGLYEPTEGDILVGGVNIRERDLFYLRKQISVVNQEILIQNDTLQNNLLLVKRDADEEELFRALRLSCLEEFVDSLPEGLQTMLEKGGTNLSGGQRQRISIARAFLKDSRILLLDEATSALDSETELKIRQAVKESNKTMIVVSHRYQTIADCDKVIVLQDGHVAEMGSPGELMERRGVFYGMFHE